MNIPGSKKALEQLRDSANELGGCCERERMAQFGPFWRAVAASAGSMATGSLDREAIHVLVRDVLAAFRYVPGGFMDMYVIRDDPKEQARENDAFEALRTRVRDAALRLDDAVEQGEASPLRIRRALVEIEGELLERGDALDAETARALLNSSELRLSEVASFRRELEKRLTASSASSTTGDGRLRTLLRELADTLAPAGD